MARKNIFEGESYRALFAVACYKLVKSRQWFTYSDIMAEHLGRSEQDLPCGVSKCDNYSELKKMFPEMRKLINEQLDCEGFEVEGSSRNMKYRYIGEDDDPLASLINAKVRCDLQQYLQFCQDSAGFFPEAWLKHFLNDTADLLEINKKRKKGKSSMMVSVDRKLENIDLLPVLYEKIKSKTAVSFTYRRGKDGETENVSILPEFLHEYNGRWQLLGYVEGKNYPIHLALDRIVGDTLADCKDVVLEHKPLNYTEYFKNTVGPTHELTGKDRPEEWDDGLKTVRVRAYTKYMYGLMKTKPLHSSQKVVEEFDPEKDYGDFELDIIVNNEFIGSVLHYGAGIEVMEPTEVRNLFAARVEKLAGRYK